MNKIDRIASATNSVASFLKREYGFRAQIMEGKEAMCAFSCRIIIATGIDILQMYRDGS